MKKNFFSQTADIVKTVVRAALYFCGVAFLGALGAKTVKLWTDKAFDLLETMKAFPAEAEFADFAAAERQMWYGIGFETFVFVIGGFLCYEFLIKPKSVFLRLVAPLTIAFLILTGESVNLFLPALDKVHEIETCQAEGIPWSARRHECDYMELERRRMEKMLAAKKPAKSRKKAAKPAVAAPQKAAAKPVAPVVKKPAPKQVAPALPAAKPAEPKPEAKPAAKPAAENAPAPAAKPKPKRKPVKKPAPKSEPKSEQPAAEQAPAPAKKLAPPKSLAP